MLDIFEPQEAPMSSTRKPAGSDDESDESLFDVPPTPDEDGPHDVPDDKVIEKTLPTRPGADEAGRDRQ